MIKSYVHFDFYLVTWRNERQSLKPYADAHYILRIRIIGSQETELTDKNSTN